MTRYQRFPTSLYRRPPLIIRRLFARARLFSRLRRVPRHPVAKHFRQQRQSQWRPPLLPLCLLYALGLFFCAAQIYSHSGQALIWTLPLWLMLFSGLYCAVWIAGIVTLLARGARAGFLDELSVIPPGRPFIYLTIGKLVLNEDEAVFWLGFLRRLLAGAVCIGFLLALAITLTQLRAVPLPVLSARLLELALLAWLVPLEHSQSTVLAWLLALMFGARLVSQIDKTSAAICAFVLLQILSYALALAVASLLAPPSLSILLIVYIFSRELLIARLWHVVLKAANASEI